MGQRKSGDGFPESDFRYGKGNCLGPAYQQARDRAQKIAELAGTRLGAVVTVDLEGGGSPPPVAGFRAMASAVPSVNPGQLSVEASLRVVYRLR